MTGMSDSLRLAELLCARLCHDLSGPLGALIGILEIAREEQPEARRWRSPRTRRTSWSSA